MVQETHINKNTQKALENFMRTNWNKVYTLDQLHNLGFGEKSTIVSRIKVSNIIYRVSRGKYQFTPWKRDSAKPAKVVVQELLENNDVITLSELSKQGNISIDTARKAVDHLRADGKCIIREASFRLVE